MRYLRICWALVTLALNACAQGSDASPYVVSVKIDWSMSDERIEAAFEACDAWNEAIGETVFRLLRGRSDRANAGPREHGRGDI